uniref:CPBP family intramembrane metalloprotease n=1 Tax=Gracilinema caldarium TaxID=215591 RepID=A0A7C3IHC9_9SPIR
MHVKKETPISALVEAFLLYWAFFIPGISLPSPSATFIPFDTARELSRIFFYNIPVVALLIFILWRENKNLLSSKFVVNRHSIFWSFINFILILASALSIALFAQYILPAYKPPLIQAPQTTAAWFVMVIGSFATAYLEEIFFRLYLLHRFDTAGIPSMAGNLLSILLFSLCHLYEGPLGTLNAAIASLCFTLIYRRAKSIHSPAWAHGLYNVLAFAFGI